jgi:hypothetical protein
MSTAALLLPLTAVPESRIQTAATGAAASASAHVNFKIVIPQVLYLRVGGESARTTDSPIVAVMSNGRRSIAQNAQCALASIPGARRYLCTASIP